MITGSSIYAMALTLGFGACVESPPVIIRCDDPSAIVSSDGVVRSIVIVVPKILSELLRRYQC